MIITVDGAEETRVYRRRRTEIKQTDIRNDDNGDGRCVSGII
jgi:hypothetical protein